MPPGEEPLLDALERYLRATTGVVVPREAWDWTQGPRAPAPDLPGRRRRRPRAGPRQGPRGAQGAAAADSSPQAIAEVAADSGHRPDRRDRLDLRRPSSPSFIAEAGRPRGARLPRRSSTRARRVGLRVFGSEAEEEARHRLGVAPAAAARRCPSPVKAVLDGLDNAQKLGLAGSPYPSVAELVEDCRAAVLGTSSTPGRRCATRPAYDALLADGRARSTRPRLRAVLADVIGVLDALAAGREGAQRPRRPGHAARADRHARPARPAGAPRLRRRGRRRPGCAATRRTSPRSGTGASGSPSRSARDRQLMDQVADLQEAYLHQVAALPEGRPPGAAPARRCAGCSRSTASRCGPSSSARRTRSATSGSARRWHAGGPGRDVA